jgi:hypothetical protein
MSTFARAAVLAVLRQRGRSKRHALAAIAKLATRIHQACLNAFLGRFGYPISAIVDGTPRSGTNHDPGDAEARP